MARIGRPLPKNVSKPVACDVEGYEGVELTYIVSQTKRVIEEAEKKSPYHIAAVVVNEVTAWPFDVEPPQHGDAQSFEDACPVDLVAWIVQGGYQKAVQTAISPN